MKHINFYSITLIIIGIFLQFLVHGSITPLLVICSLLLPTVLILSVCRLLQKYELKAFLLSFSTCYIWSSISAIYRLKGDDFFQLESDAYRFWLYSTEIDKNLSIDNIYRFTDGSGAVYIWREFYRFFESWNIPLEPDIGIYVNCMIVAATSTLIIKIIKTAYGYDTRRMLLAAYLYAFLGTLWIYASIHVRDCYILFLMTLLVLLIIRLIQKFTLSRLLVLVLYSAIWILFFQYLRIEYKYIPLVSIGVAFAISGFTSKNILSKSSIIILVIFNLIFMAVNFSQVSTILEDDADITIGVTWGNQQSLGYKYVVDAPAPMRMVLGSFYVHAFPVPAWGGFIQTDTSYHFLKSTTAFYMLYTMPLALAGVMKVIRRRLRKDNAIPIFAAAFYLIFTISVVMTSLEIRHLGSFVSALILLTVYPDAKVRRDKSSIKFWRISWIGAVVLMHIGYYVLKM